MVMKRFRYRYKFCLWKSYFEKGYGITHWFKYIVLLFGWASGDVRTTTYVAIAYAIACFIIGFYWYKYMQLAESEVANQYNLFQREVRAKLK